ncbi:hypothetical protein NFJ02_03g100190 [Pycnococcus provasolii]
MSTSLAGRDARGGVRGRGRGQGQGVRGQGVFGHMVFVVSSSSRGISCPCPRPSSSSSSSSSLFRPQRSFLLARAAGVSPAEVTARGVTPPPREEERFGHSPSEGAESSSSSSEDASARRGVSADASHEKRRRRKTQQRRKPSSPPQSTPSSFPPRLITQQLDGTRAGARRAAQLVHEHTQRNGTTFDSRDAVSVIKDAGRRRDADTAAQLLLALCEFERNANADVSAAAALTDHAFAAAISLYARERRTEKAISLHEDMMVRHNVRPSAFTFAGVLTALAEEARRDERAATKAAGELARMWDYDVRPNRVCHNLVLKAHAHAGHAREADELVENMRARGMKLDAMSLRHCLEAAGRAGDANLARRYFDELSSMRSSSGAQSRDIRDDCNMLVAALARSGDAEGAAAFVRAMPQEAGVAADRWTYNALLNALARAPEVDEADARARLRQALALYKEMAGDRDGGNVGPPDVRTYDAMLRLYGACGEWREALRIVEGVSCADEQLYASTVYACCRARQPRWAIEAARRGAAMVRRPLSSNALAALMAAFAREKEGAKAINAYRDVATFGNKRGAACFAALLVATGCSDVDDGEKLGKALLRGVVRKYEGRSGGGDDEEEEEEEDIAAAASELLTGFEPVGVPDRAIFHAALTARLAWQTRVDSGAYFDDVLESMRRLGVVPDGVTHALFIRCAARSSVLSARYSRDTAAARLVSRRKAAVAQALRRAAESGYGDDVQVKRAFERVMLELDDDEMSQPRRRKAAVARAVLFNSAMRATTEAPPWF